MTSLFPQLPITKWPRQTLWSMSLPIVFQSKSNIGTSLDLNWSELGPDWTWNSSPMDHDWTCHWTYIGSTIGLTLDQPLDLHWINNWTHIGSTIGPQFGLPLEPTLDNLGTSMDQADGTQLDILQTIVAVQPFITTSLYLNPTPTPIHHA